MRNSTNTYFKILPLLLTGVLVVGIQSAFAQARLEDVNFSLISQKKIKHFIDNRIEDKIFAFTDLHRSFTSTDNLSNYHTHEKTYLVEATPNQVWEAYISSDPTQIWNGKMMAFGLMYSGKTDEVVYANNHFTGMEEGQICFIGFKIWRGMYKLAASFEVTKIDSTQRILEFTYMDGGKTKGRQQVQFLETPEGWTRIVHTTQYKSDSKFRDKRLYPHFHTVAIDEFHANMQAVVLKKRQQLGLAQ